MNSDIAYPGIGGAVFAMVGIWSVVVIGLYVWYLWSLARLFPYLGLPKAHGWIPVWNQWRLIERGGLPGWMVLLGLVPGLNVVVLVVSIIAIHRINSEHNEGAGMTVLGAFIPPLWATLLGSRLRDRGYGPTSDRSQTQGATGAFAGRGLVEYGPNGQVYPLLNTNGGQVPVQPMQQAPQASHPPQAPQAPVSPQQSAGQGFAMPPVPTMSPAPNAGQPQMPPAPAMPPAPGAPAQQQSSTPVAPPAEKQWSLGKTVDSNFERLANEENPAMDRLFAANENARPFSWPEPQPHGQVLPAPPAAQAAPAQPPAAQPPVAQPPVAKPPLPAFMPPAPPAQNGVPPVAAPVPPAAPAISGIPATPVTPVAPAASGGSSVSPPLEASGKHAVPAAHQGPPTVPTYAPPIPKSTAASAPVAPTPTANEQSEDELDRTVVVPRKAAWVIELPDGRELDLLGDDIVIGRKPTAVGESDVLVVPDPTRTLSKSHARLRRTSDAWTIEDLNSTNGVFVFDGAGVQIEVEPGTQRLASEHLIIGTLEVRLRRAG